MGIGLQNNVNEERGLAAWPSNWQESTPRHTLYDKSLQCWFGLDSGYSVDSYIIVGGRNVKGFVHGHH